MNPFFTPLLRWLYLGLALVLGIHLGISTLRQTSWNKERLLRKLVFGMEQERIAAGAALVEARAQPELLRALQVPSPHVRRIAVHSLWELWFKQAGTEACLRVLEADRVADEEQFEEAIRLLSALLRKFPHYAEGWNRRAVIYWRLGRYQEAIADCQAALRINPDHFAAWQGMAHSQWMLGQLEEACSSFQAALRINPHDPVLRKYLQACQERHRTFPPRSPHFPPTLIRHRNHTPASTP